MTSDHLKYPCDDEIASLNAEIERLRGIIGDIRGWVHKFGRQDELNALISIADRAYEQKADVK